MPIDVNTSSNSNKINVTVGGGSNITVVESSNNNNVLIESVAPAGSTSKVVERGPSGTSGTSGSSGSSGFSGSSGSSGSSGASGISGSSGTSGSSGSSGASGISGSSGSSGTSGTSGSSGVGVPIGGSQNQILIKNSSIDYATAWSDVLNGNALFQSFTYSSHGFNIGDILRYETGSWYKAKADTDQNAEVVGMVQETTANAFNLVLNGKITGLSGLTFGEVYFLSPDTAGAFTANEPTTNGQISRPILFGLTSTTANVLNYRGVEILSAAIENPSLLSGNACGAAVNYNNNVFAVTSGVNSDLFSIDSLGNAAVSGNLELANIITNSTGITVLVINNGVIQSIPAPTVPNTYLKYNGTSLVWS